MYNFYTVDVTFFENPLEHFCIAIYQREPMFQKQIIGLKLEPEMEQKIKTR
jgi:hypothetical protein